MPRYRKTITIIEDLNSAQSAIFTRNIILPFHPNYMKVKQITFGGIAADPEDGAYGIYCTPLGYVIGSFVDKCSVCPDTVFDIPIGIGLTNWEFKVVDPDMLAAALDGFLILTLEFGIEE